MVVKSFPGPNAPSNHKGKQQMMLIHSQFHVAHIRIIVILIFIFIWKYQLARQ